MANKRKTSLFAFSKRLFHIASAVKGKLFVSTLASILGNIAQMGLVGFGAAFILSTAGLLRGSRILYALLMALSAAIIIAGRYVEGVISHAGAYRLLADLRVEMFQHVRRLSPARLVDRSSGDLLAAAIGDIETLEFFFAHTIGPLFTVVLLPLITLILACSVDGLYALVLLPVYLIISVILPAISLKSGRKIGQAYRKQVAEYQSLTLESIYSLRDIQIFGHADARRQLLSEKNRQINRTNHIQTLHRQLVTSAPTFFIYLARILVIAVASVLAVKSPYQATGVVLLSYVVSASFSSTQSLTMVISNLIETFAAAERIFAVQDAEPEVREAPDAKVMEKVEEIRLDELSFSYGPQFPELLHNVDLTIHSGDKIGIMGESGIGKSTVIRLLLRFWEPTGGAVRVNGEDLRHFSLESLHRRVALLEQDTFLFDATIADNIALGKPDATREEIVQAAKTACIHDFILTLPEGYETRMGEMADRLSGGERQRIGIARTVLMEPDVLILDEPTSSLDVLNERSFLKMLHESYAEKTVIIVSHRMSTLSGCNRLFRLENGRLEEL